MGPEGLIFMCLIGFCSFLLGFCVGMLFKEDILNKED